MPQIKYFGKYSGKKQWYLFGWLLFHSQFFRGDIYISVLRLHWLKTGLENFPLADYNSVTVINYYIPNWLLLSTCKRDLFKTPNTHTIPVVQKEKLMSLLNDCSFIRQIEEGTQSSIICSYKLTLCYELQSRIGKKYLHFIYICPIGAPASTAWIFLINARLKNCSRDKVRVSLTWDPTDR